MKTGIRFDLHEGLKRQWTKYILLFVTVIITCIHFDGIVINDIRIRQYSPGFLNYVMYMFQGIKPFYYTTQEKHEIPAFWLFFNIYILFVLGGYLSDNLKTDRSQCFVRYSSRTRFMVNKYVYMIIGIILYYACLYTAVFIYIAIKGHVKMYEYNIGAEINLITPDVYPSILYGICEMVVIPFLTSCTYVAVYMIFEICGNKSWGMTVISAYILAGAFICHPLFISNNTMLIRNEYVINNGISLESGLAITLIFLAIDVAAGITALKRFEFTGGLKI